MTAKSHAQRQRDYRSRQQLSRDGDRAILLTILSEIQSLRDLVTRHVTSPHTPLHMNPSSSSFPILNLSSVETSTKKGARRAARLAADWQPTTTEEEYARAKGLDPTLVAERFCNYWWAKSGAAAAKMDWSATWRNWCIVEAERKGTLPGVSTPHRQNNGPPEMTPEEHKALGDRLVAQADENIARMLKERLNGHARIP